jgi:hypothetical protein
MSHTHASDVGDEFDRLAGNSRHSLIVMIVAEHRQPFAFRGSGDQQVDRADRPMRSGFSQQLLNFPGAQPGGISQCAGQDVSELKAASKEDWGGSRSNRRR